MIDITRIVYNRIIRSFVFVLHNTYYDTSASVIIVTHHYYDSEHNITIVLRDEYNTQADAHSYTLDVRPGKLSNVVIQHGPPIDIPDTIDF